ncbi:related to triacylglycerol lipase [Phialocephala subalpina]|uniref:Related to triacylglycerol lipase n=1 Tax=Phialocephala subalpina TaxID=576137 RepID=A0A1L7WVP1_9HELO|nr:related to triacylglycerol lipase [Phialocephala subalpina]
MTRLSLRLKAFLVRTIQSIFTLFDLYFSHPLPQRVSFTRKIKSTVSSIPGSIDLLFYTPPSYTKSSSKTVKKHLLLVNFHGGGLTIGHAKDDARWATSVTNEASAVVCSVEYRLAPSYPFPVGIEDCVSAVLWLWKHADEFNLDISKTAFSGFSGGGNLCYAVSIRLHEELERLKREGKLDAGLEEGKVVSLVVFYGSTDQTLSRAEKDASNPNLIPTIPPFLFKLFDESYLSSNPDLISPLLSPGIASDEVLREGLPDRLVMINCGGDQLLVEGERFRQRLKGLGKVVDGYVVEGVGHGWDKKPTWKGGDKKRDEAYAFAVKSLNGVWSLV